MQGAMGDKGDGYSIGREEGLPKEFRIPAADNS